MNNELNEMEKFPKMIIIREWWTILKKDLPAVANVESESAWMLLLLQLLLLFTVNTVFDDGPLCDELEFVDVAFTFAT